VFGPSLQGQHNYETADSARGTALRPENGGIGTLMPKRLPGAELTYDNDIIYRLITL
jgi:hypothetical protein